jgi:hypothetical protein
MAPAGRSFDFAWLRCRVSTALGQSDTSPFSDFGIRRGAPPQRRSSPAPKKFKFFRLSVSLFILVRALRDVRPILILKNLLPWALEGFMSDDTVHVLVAVGIITLMFAWVPFLNVLCPPGWRSVEKSPNEKKEGEVQRRETHSISPLTSRHLAHQSRDFLEALSTRGGRKVSHSESPGVPPRSCAE